VAAAEPVTSAGESSTPGPGETQLEKDRRVHRQPHTIGCKAEGQRGWVTTRTPAPGGRLVCAGWPWWVTPNARKSSPSSCLLTTPEEGRGFWPRERSSSPPSIPTNATGLTPISQAAPANGYCLPDTSGRFHPESSPQRLLEAFPLPPGDETLRAWLLDRGGSLRSPPVRTTAHRPRESSDSLWQPGPPHRVIGNTRSLRCHGHRTWERPEAIEPEMFFSFPPPPGTGIAPPGTAGVAARLRLEQKD